MVRFRGPFVPALLLAIACGMPPSAASPPAAGTPAASTFEGYGRQAVGGSGGGVCRVTSLSGAAVPGSLAECVTDRNGPRTVVFDVGGTITLNEHLRVRVPFLTIDGTTAPAPGITIRPPSGGEGDAIYIEATHDVIVKGLRLVGFGRDGNGGDLISIYGNPAPCYNIVVDHCTLEAADDGAIDITRDGHDITVSWSLFHNNQKAQLVKYGELKRLSIHHNVYASSTPLGERNPLLWGDVTDVDYVNNIVFDWFWYGVGIRHEGDGDQPGKRVSANIVNNLFQHQEQATASNALIYGPGPGPDPEDGGPAGSPPQGTLVASSRMGELWVSGNILPPQNQDQYSTVSQPRMVPAAARVTTWPASELKTRVLPAVGAPFPTPAERALLDKVSRAEAGAAAHHP